MKVVITQFPWLRWARSERPAPANEEFPPAQQPLPITKFCSTVESRIPTANEGFSDISRCPTPNKRFSNISSLTLGSEHQESCRKLLSLPPIQMMRFVTSSWDTRYVSDFSDLNFKESLFVSLLWVSIMVDLYKIRAIGWSSDFIRPSAEGLYTN